MPYGRNVRVTFEKTKPRPMYHIYAHHRPIYTAIPCITNVLWRSTDDDTYKYTKEFILIYVVRTHPHTYANV